MSTIEPSFDSIQSTIELVLLSVFQDIQFPEYSLTAYKNTQVLPSIFFYLLFLVFNTFAIQFFIAILVFPFASLRQRYQVALEALETYESSMSISSSMQLWCLITFQMVELKKADKNLHTFAKEEKPSLRTQTLPAPKTSSVKLAPFISDPNPIHSRSKTQGPLIEDKAGQEQKRASGMRGDKSIDSEGKDLGARAKQMLKDKEPAKPDQSKENIHLGWGKKTILQILKSNIDFLIGNTTGSVNIVSRDNYIDKMENLIEDFSRRRKKAVKGKVREVTTGVFSNLLSSILYFIYIVIFVSMLSQQFKNTNTYDSLKAFENYVESLTFRYDKYSKEVNFNEIKTLLEYRTWIQSVAASNAAGRHLPRRRLAEDQSEDFQRAVHHQQRFHRLSKAESCRLHLQRRPLLQQQEKRLPLHDYSSKAWNNWGFRHQLLESRD